MKQVLLRDFVDMNFVVDSKKLVATLETLHIKRERVQLIYFNGEIIFSNHLSRKNLPWRIGSSWVTAEKLVEVVCRYLRLTTRKECVFAACWLIGDQSSLKTLQNLVEDLVEDEDGYRGTILQRQEHVLASFNVTDDEICEMMDVPDWKWQWFRRVHPQKVKGFFIWQNLSEKLSIKKGLIVQYRLEWRKLYSDKNNDCRTYRGQPDRDMVCV